MGKIKRERQKFHITSTEDKPTHKIAESHDVPKYKALPLDATNNIFAGINIQLNNLSKLDDDHQDSPVKANEDEIATKTEIVNSKAGKSSKQSAPVDAVDGTTKTNEKQLSKKEKMRQKHQRLMEKLDVVQQARKQSKEKQKTTKQKKESLLPKTMDFSRILLTPPAIIQPMATTTQEKPIKNIFSIPSFNDELPALTSIFKTNSSQSKIDLFGTKKEASGVQKHSKGIKKDKKKFVSNYNMLKKMMALKKK